jgi:phage tail-like protein
MRGTVAGLRTPYPIASLLPAVYQEEDPFIGRFTAGLDDVLASVISTLDCLEAYVDPLLAPEDFLAWVAGWVGVAVNENAPVALHRASVARAAELHRLRGTVPGLRTALELLTGGEVEIADSGGTAISVRPGAAAPGDPRPWLRVRVTVPADTAWSPEALLSAVETAVEAAKPAHVQHSVEVYTR